MELHHDTPQKAVADAIAAAGSQQKLADAIGRLQRNVWDWLHGRAKEVPPADAMKIERLYGISRRRLAPSFDWSAMEPSAPTPPPTKRRAA